MSRAAAYILATAALLYSASAQTPVIGGSCKVGTPDVQIGGKQTQFFLKCEATAESTNGEGVWVVKSRSAASPTVAPTTASPPENMPPPQQRPPMFSYTPNICEQNLNAREGDSCSVSATCLQSNVDNIATFLQCEQASMRWIKKSCQDTFIFDFEKQACVVPRFTNRNQHRQQTTQGLLCTFSSCSNSNPCSSGTCNNGYCCSSSGNTGTQIIVAQPSSGSSCNGCQQAPQIITIPSCPGGSSSYGNCASSGFCATGYQCIQGSCCPSYNQPSVSVYTCPGGGSAVGSCVSGSCATGYSCSNNNQCCPTTNPFVCSDGTQAAGGCVNNLCGTGYTCTNGLCCASTSSSPKCLDGSPAVGACIPSCQGNGCGGTTLTYYCGSGYTCTTGNICCPTTSCPDGGEPIGPTVNGLCPTGYSAQGNQCCSIVNTCLAGEENIGLPVNTLCPSGAVLRGSACCLSTTVQFAQPCITTVQIAGACTGLNAGDPCSANLGYACRSDADGVATGATACCPMVDYINDRIGPALDGNCPIDSTPVTVDGTLQCVLLQSIPGLCATTAQSGPCISGECPTGFTCNIFAEVCCSDTALAMTLSRHKKVLPGMPPHSIYATAKPVPQGNTAIGSSCSTSQQCAGFSDGLSKCERRVCRCTSIAYAKGIACVRKKMLMFNDEPVPVEGETNSVVAAAAPPS